MESVIEIGLLTEHAPKIAGRKMGKTTFEIVDITEKGDVKLQSIDNEHLFVVTKGSNLGETMSKAVYYEKKYLETLTELRDVYNEHNKTLKDYSGEVAKHCLLLDEHTTLQDSQMDLLSKYSVLLSKSIDDTKKIKGYEDFHWN